MNTIDDSTALGLGMLTFVLIVVLYVWTALALSAVFRKSGEQPWKAWVPIYNQVVLLQLGGFSGWLFLLILLPFVGPLLVWALLIAACYRINVAFGHGVGMTVLAALLLPVWASILGFGPARWLGTELTGRGSPGGGPRRTAAPDLDDTAAYVPRATPPAYTPSLPRLRHRPFRHRRCRRHPAGLRRRCSRPRSRPRHPIPCARRVSMLRSIPRRRPSPGARGSSRGPMRTPADGADSTSVP